MGLLVAARVEALVLAKVSLELKTVISAIAYLRTRKIKPTFLANKGLKKGPDAPKNVFPVVGFGKEVEVTDEVKVFFGRVC